jgi:hypothetical protein
VADHRYGARGTVKPTYAVIAYPHTSIGVEPLHEVGAGLRRLAEEMFRARRGRGRVDMGFAEHNDGEL